MEAEADRQSCPKDSTHTLSPTLHTDGDGAPIPRIRGFATYPVVFSSAQSSQQLPSAFSSGSQRSRGHRHDASCSHGNADTALVRRSYRYADQGPHNLARPRRRRKHEEQFAVIQSRRGVRGVWGSVSDRSPTLPDQSHCSPSHVPDLDPSVHVMAQLLPDRPEYGTDTKAWEPGRSPLPACVIHELCALADCRFRRPIAHAPGEKFDSAHNFVGDTYRKSGAFVAAAEELTTSKVVVDEWVVLVTPAWSRRFRSHCRAPARCGIVSNPVRTSYRGYVQVHGRTRRDEGGDR